MFSSRQSRIGIICAVLGLTAASVWAQAPGRGRHGTHEGVEGRWDITVSEGDSQYPSWLGIQQQDGKRVVKFLGRAGSVHALSEGDYKIEGDTIQFKAAGREWTGKVTENSIDGTWKKSDGQGKWTAKRFWRRSDPSGAWDLKVGDAKATLKLTRAQRSLEGTWSEGGKETAIKPERTRGSHGQMQFAVGDKNITLSLKGDTAEGTAGSQKITGRRERKWGKPIELFAGKKSDLSANWEPLGSNENHWKVIDGVMTNGDTVDPAKAAHLGTENIVTKRKDFKDFKLHVEFMVPPRGNSGVYLRGRYEIQVQDDYGKPIADGVCGSLYTRVLPKVNACKPAGEWQTYDIQFVDGYVTVVQNGQTIIDNAEVEGITGGAIDSNEASTGPIYLQGDHSQIMYRKIVLTPAE